MRKLLMKEMTLSASLLSYLFIGFSLMFFIPGYPILCGAFFVTLGLFQSFQNIRETNDIVFSVLLPIAKKDVVKGKYLFVCLIELSSLLVMFIITLFRMTILKDVPVYLQNTLMNANFFALGGAFLIFGLFNWIFVGGFFKTAYKIGKPFVHFMIMTALLIILFETLHHIPSLAALNAFGFDHFALQLSLLSIEIMMYCLMTLLSDRQACNTFEKIDL